MRKGRPSERCACGTRDLLRLLHRQTQKRHNAENHLRQQRSLNAKELIPIGDERNGRLLMNCRENCTVRWQMSHLSLKCGTITALKTRCTDWLRQESAEQDNCLNISTTSYDVEETATVSGQSWKL